METLYAIDPDNPDQLDGYGDLVYSLVDNGEPNVFSLNTMTGLTDPDGRRIHNAAQILVVNSGALNFEPITRGELAVDIFSLEIEVKDVWSVENAAMAVLSWK